VLKDPSAIEAKALHHPYRTLAGPCRPGRGMETAESTAPDNDQVNGRHHRLSDWGQIFVGQPRSWKAVHSTAGIGLGCHQRPEPLLLVSQSRL